MNEKHLSTRFRAFKSGNIFVGHYIILSKAIRGMKYGKMKVVEAFNKLVPKSDYAQDEKESLLENLWSVTQDDFRPELPLF